MYVQQHKQYNRQEVQIQEQVHEYKNLWVSWIEFRYYADAIILRKSVVNITK